MCGFVGRIGGQPGDLVERLLTKALRLLETRGPDGEGTWREAGAAMGHRRLAVLDLSDAAHQPMLSTDGRFVIVFNGEIYNYLHLKQDPVLANVRWRGTGDTEVVLAAYQSWGAECVTRLEGMFAFAIWDREDRRLLLCRDRLGVKPLYYRLESDSISFGSRPTAVQAICGSSAPSVDFQAIRDYLDLGFVPAPRTGFRGLLKLPAGCTLTWTGGGVSLRRYWLPSDRTAEGERAGRNLDAARSLDEVVLDSVESRLVSDVPVGAFLSGGLDSSIVVAAMARLRDRDVDTFTIGFRERGVDESARARAVARRLGVRNECEVLEPRDLVALLPRYLQAFDEPFCDSSAFAVLAVARLARQRVTVALSGDGGDEMFGGYHYYMLMRWLRLLRFLPPAARRGGAWAAARSGSRRLGMLAGAVRQDERLRQYWYLRSIRKSLPSVMAPEALASTVSSYEIVAATCRLVSRVMSDPGYWAEIDKLLVLPDDYLQKVDVATMAFSLEAREPLLATAIAEYAARLDGRSKVGWVKSKQLLRDLVARWVGSDLFDARKRGFSVPVGGWLRDELRPWAQDLIEDGQAAAALGIDQAAVKALWHGHVDGGRDAGTYLWAVVMLFAWYRHQAHGVSV